MKIRACSNYASSEQLVAEIERQFKPPVDLVPFEWVFDHSYALLFIFNDWAETPRVPKEQIYVIAQEPQWSPNYRDWNGRCAEFIAPVNGNYPLMFYHHGLSWQECETINPVKTKKLSYCCAKGPEGIPGTLYEKRNRLVEALIESDIDIDVYGRGWDFDSPKWKGEPLPKAKSLIDYEYAISCENSYHPFYVTEKYWDIVACKAIPINLTRLLIETDNINFRSFDEYVTHLEMSIGRAVSFVGRHSYCIIKHDNNILNYIHSKVQSHE